MSRAATSVSRERPGACPVSANSALPPSATSACGSRMPPRLGGPPGLGVALSVCSASYVGLRLLRAPTQWSICTPMERLYVGTLDLRAVPINRGVWIWGSWCVCCAVRLCWSIVAALRLAVGRPLPDPGTTPAAGTRANSAFGTSAGFRTTSWCYIMFRL